MKPELRRIGEHATPVVVIDDFAGGAEPIVELAARLAPFPPHQANHYPGVRRILSEADRDAFAYIERTLTEAAQYIAGAFDIESFDLLEASFSMVTLDPLQLAPPQRAPHFDTTDPRHLAVLHYLNAPQATGTAFYRQRSTGIELVSEANVATFVQTAEREAAELPADSGYILGSDKHFEQTAAVDAVADRLVIYPGSLLHSGIIPPGMRFSSDPREGRLTANMFVRGN